MGLATSAGAAAPGGGARSVVRHALVGGGRRRPMILASALLASHMAGEAAVPVVIGAIVDRAVEPSDRSALVAWLAVLVAVFVVLSLSFRFGYRRAARNVEEAAHDLRLAVTARTLAPHGLAARDGMAGAVLSTATADASRVAELHVAVARAASAASALAVAAVALLRVSVPLALVVLVGVPVALRLVHLVGGPLERRSAAEQAATARASGMAADLVGGLRVLKGIGAGPAAADRYRGASRTSLGAAVRAATASAGYQGATALVPGLFLAAVALVAGRMAAEGTISVGDFVAVIGLAQFLQGPFAAIAMLGMRVAQARASAERVATVLDAPPATPVLAPEDAVRAASSRAGTGGVRFRAAAGDGLGPLDLEVAAGEVVGLVAPDPAHATAVLAWLARLRDPASGTVELDGTPLTALAPDAVRRAIVVSPHDADLFEGTIADNVAARAASPAAAERAGRAATVDLLAAELPDGTATPVGERGRALSGGQRQRVALARALAAESPVLVLHDPTTAVDTVTEAAVARGVRELRSGRTTIVATTSPTLLAACDRVVVLDGGTVRADGAHHELVAADARYNELVLA